MEQANETEDTVSQGPTGDVRVVPAGAQDWAAVREVRLAALADSPSAFRSTLEQEAAFDEDRWRSWAASGRVFLAVADGQHVGMAAGAVEEERADVVAMWVAPGWRGGPAASLLLRAVTGWAREAGMSQVGLAVMATNERATAFYERHGFVVVTTKPTRKDPALLVHRMVLTTPSPVEAPRTGRPT